MEGKVMFIFFTCHVQNRLHLFISRVPLVTMRSSTTRRASSSSRASNDWFGSLGESESSPAAAESGSPRRHVRRHDDPRSTRVATCLRLPNLAVHRRKPLPVYSRQINLAVHRRKPLRVYLCLMNPADHRPGQAAVRKGTNTCSCLTNLAGHPPPNQAVRRNPQMW
jgi:hypothetical protein